MITLLLEILPGTSVFVVLCHDFAFDYLCDMESNLRYQIRVLVNRSNCTYIMTVSYSTEVMLVIIFTVPSTKQKSFCKINKNILRFQYIAGDNFTSALFHGINYLKLRFHTLSFDNDIDILTS